MRNSLNQGGESGFVKKLLVLLVAGCIAIIFLLLFLKNFQGVSFNNLSTGTNYTSRFQGGVNPLLDFGNSSYNPGSSAGYYSGDAGRNVPNVDGTLNSPYAGKVSLSAGNARSAIQTYEEYVTLKNGGTPVNITGWVIANGKGSRPIEYAYNNYVYPVADSAIIGEGTGFLSPDGRFQVGPIILESGDTAILQTGKPFTQFPFSIYTGFRENICVGYLEDYPFTPSLSLSCPALATDPFIRTVTDQCYDYMVSMNRCQDPEDLRGKAQERYELLTSDCRRFIEARSNYQGCVAGNKDRPNFSTKQWRVFLGKERELWAQGRETITLYDAQGFIVDRLTY